MLMDSVSVCTQSSMEYIPTWVFFASSLKFSLDRHPARQGWVLVCLHVAEGCRLVARRVGNMEDTIHLYICPPSWAPDFDSEV